MPAFAALLGPGYTLFSKKAESQLSINCWREQIESGQGSQGFVMYRSFGLSPYITDIPAGEGRGSFEQNGHLFTVTDQILYDYIGATRSAYYTGIAGSGQVTMAASPDTLMICAGNRLFRINAMASGSPATEIALTFTPAWVVFLKNYFVVGELESSRFYWSADDGATFPADQVQTAEADANFIQMGATIHQLLWLIGSKITQVFYVGPNPNAPFVPNDGGIVRSGTRAPNSVKALGESLFWLESTAEGSNSVVRTNGYTPDKVSNNYIASELNKLPVTSDAIGQPFQMGDHRFYRLTFPSSDKTFEFHDNLNEWEEVAWFDWRGGQYHRHRANSICFAFDLILAADHTNGIIYKMAIDNYTDYGFPLKMTRRTPHILGDANKRIAYDRLDVGAETGVGLSNPLWLHSYNMQRAAFVTALATAVSGGNVTAAQALVLQSIYDFLPYTPLNTYPSPQVMYDLGFVPWGAVRTVNDGSSDINIGANPELVLRYSNDGGENWSNELRRSLGASGETNRQVYWNRMSEAVDRVWELTYDAPCKLALTNAWLNAPEELAG